MNPMNPNSKRFLVMATTLMMAAILMALALPHPANAFHLVGIGPRVGFTDPEGVDNTLNVGGGLDYKVFFKNFSWRFQGDYMHTHYASATQNDYRASTGIVWRF